MPALDSCHPIETIHSVGPANGGPIGNFPEMLRNQRGSGQGEGLLFQILL